MQPHAEMVHWAFAAGILFVGLCLLCEAIVGQEVWRMRPLAEVPLAGARVRARRPALAGDGVLHELGDPHVRARIVGRGADARGRRRARARARPADVAALAADVAARVRRHRASRSSCTSRTRGSSRGRRSCTTCSAGRSSSARSCAARARVASAVGRVAGGIRGDDRRRLGPCSSPTATSRRSSVTSRRSLGRSTDEAPRARALVALAFPAAASAHATLRSTTPPFRHRAAARRRARSACASTSK